MTYRITVWTEDKEKANALYNFLKYSSYDAEIDEIDDDEDEGEALSESEA